MTPRAVLGQRSFVSYTPSWSTSVADLLPSIRLRPSEPPKLVRLVAAPVVALSTVPWFTAPSALILSVGVIAARKPRPPITTGVLPQGPLPTTDTSGVQRSES